MSLVCPLDSSNESESEKTDELTFHNACHKGDLEAVKVYLAQPGFDMNVGNDDGGTGFHCACANGKLNVVHFLLQQGFDMNFSDHDGKTGFHWACGDFDWNICDNDESTGFHWASHHGNLNVVQFLLQLGFDMNICDNHGSTGFHLACFNGNLNVVQFLVQKEFDINICDNTGNTGFHDACFCANLNVLQFLIQQGFDIINDLGINKKTGLEMLIEERYVLSSDRFFMPCILLLIEAGAQLNDNHVYEGLSSAIQNRIIEITIMKEIIFEKWTGRIAQTITEYTMEPFTKTSLQNLSQVLN